MKRLKIGVIIGNANSPHTMEIMRGINKAASECEVETITFTDVLRDPYYELFISEETDDDYKKFSPRVHGMQYAELDALIVPLGTMSNFLSNEDLEIFRDFINKYPHVILEVSALDDNGSFILSDSYNGIYAITNHLIKDHNLKKLCFLAGTQTNPESLERLRAFSDCLKVHRLDLEPRQIAHGDFSELCDDQVNKLIDDNPDLQAIVCANDTMASTAMKVLRSRGRIPGKDVAVTGFDDWEIGRYLSPALTTVSQNPYQMGYEALYELMSVMSGRSPKGLVLQNKVIFRESCGCCNNLSNSSKNSDIFPIIIDYEERFSNFKNKSWALPWIINNLLRRKNTEQDFFLESVKDLDIFGAKKAFIYAFDKPVHYREIESSSVNTKLRLKSYFDSQGKVSLEDNEAYVITENIGFDIWKYENHTNQMVVFPLTTEKYIYGYLLVDIPADEIHFFYQIKLHLTNGMKYLDLSREQRKTQEELAQKNELLEMISEFDPLTGIYNRRGLSNHARSFFTKYNGSKASLIYADLDHLKSINDLFGHAEGDLAICKTAELLSSAVTDTDIVARLGGDEYILLVHQSDDSDNSLYEKIKSIFSAYNAESDQAYYLDVTLGVLDFVCSEQSDIDELTLQADKSMYMGKKNKRDSILK